MYKNHTITVDKIKIRVVEIVGSFVGNYALDIQRHLYSSLNGEGVYQIVDFNQARQIDGVGIAMLESFLSRGMEIRLINMSPEVRSVIGMAKKESLLQRIYNEKDCERAASLFVKDIVEKKLRCVPRKRHHARVRASFRAEFNIRKNGGDFSLNANILDLSEGGVLAGQVVAKNSINDEIGRCEEMVDREIFDLKFKLNGNATSISVQGRCVRAYMLEKVLYAGICFGELDRHQRQIIRSFVESHIGVE